MKVIYKTYLKYIFLFILLCGSFRVSASIINGTIDNGQHNAQLCLVASCVKSIPPDYSTWVEWKPSGGGVSITDSALSGYIWGGTLGWVVLNCANTTSGCTGTGIGTNGNFKVANDNNGNLSGYAWGGGTGWINFNSKVNCDVDNNGFVDTACGTTISPENNATTPIVDFKVTINASGQFAGYAWTQNFGYIKFDCNLNIDYCVQTDWRPRNSRPQCSDFIDNDSDGLVDSADPGCHIDGNASNGSSYSPNNNSEFTLTDPGGDWCDTHPTDPSCLPFCTAHPTDPTCLPFCTTHPTDPTCMPFCATHPNDSSCNPPPFCAINPNDPSCRNPHDGGGGKHFCNNDIDDDQDGLIDLDDPGCKNDPTGDSEVDIPSFCSLHPNDATCNPPNNFCTLHPTDPSCIKTPTIIDKISGINGKAITKVAVPIIVATGALSGVLFSFLTSLFASPLSFSEIFLIPIRLWSLLLAALGIKKRNRPWGTVYDSVTKQPLDPAYVTLFDLQGKEVATSITDISGRYGFLIPPGQYRITAGKTNYEFPSKKLLNKMSDEMYPDLYFGDIITIAEGQVITKNIPMDALNFDWNEFAKRKQDLVKFYSRRDIWITRFSNILFVFGFSVTAIALLVAPKLYNIITFAVYVLIFILKHTLLKPRPFGRLAYKGTGVPLAFAIVRVYTVGSDREVIKKVSDRTGKYYCLIPNGAYYVKIDVKNSDGSYSPAYTSSPFEVKDGYLRKTFEV